MVDCIYPGYSPPFSINRILNSDEIMASFGFTLLFLVLFSHCGETMVGIKFQTYLNRDTTYTLEDPQQSKLVQLYVAKLFEGTEEIMRVFLDVDRIESLHTEERFIEIFYETPITLESKKLGAYKIRKVLIPLTGDFAGNETSPVVTMIIGDEEYLSNPFRNLNGRPVLMQLDSLLLNLTSAERGTD